MGTFGFALVWRQIFSKAFPPSAINPPSHLPSALHLVPAQSCCHSDSLLSTPFLSFPSSMHPQLLCLLVPFPPATCFLFSYSVSPCSSTLQSSSFPKYAFLLKYYLANLQFNFPALFHWAKFPFFLHTTSHQFPALAFAVLKNKQFTLCLPGALKGAGAGDTPAPRAQVCTTAAQGTITEKVLLRPVLENGLRMDKTSEESNTDF